MLFSTFQKNTRTIKLNNESSEESKESVTSTEKVAVILISQHGIFSIRHACL